MAAVRLDDKADTIENTLSLVLLETSKKNTNSSVSSLDPLASSSWDEVTFLTLSFFGD